MKGVPHTQTRCCVKAVETASTNTIAWVNLGIMGESKVINLKVQHTPVLCHAGRGGWESNADNSLSAWSRLNQMGGDRGLHCVEQGWSGGSRQHERCTIQQSTMHSKGTGIRKQTQSSVTHDKT